MIVFTYRNPELIHPFLSNVRHESALSLSIPALHALLQLAGGRTAAVIFQMEETGVTLLSFFNPRVATQIAGAYLEALWSLDP